jgi:hypothetical protein
MHTHPALKILQQEMQKMQWGVNKPPNNRLQRTLLPCLANEGVFDTRNAAEPNR